MAWIRKNFQIITAISVIILTIGGSLVSLETKTDAIQVQKIARKEIDDHAFPLIQGVEMATTIKNIEKNQLLIINGIKYLEEKLSKKIDNLKKKKIFAE
jgi:hypothetical protein